MRNTLFKFLCLIAFCFFIDDSYATSSSNTIPIPNPVYENTMALFDAIKELNYDVVKYLLDKGADVNAKNKYGMTPLMVAFQGDLSFSEEGKANALNIAKILLDRGANVNAVSNNEYRYTALRLAVSKDNIKAVKLLLVRGANIIPPNERYGDGALRQAVRDGHTEITKILLDNGWAGGISKEEGGNAMVDAIATARPKIVDLLRGKGVAINPSMLNYAAMTCNSKAMEILLNNGLGVNQYNSFVETPLMKAVDGNCTEVVRVLLQRGANITLKDSEGKTVMNRLESEINALEQKNYLPSEIKEKNLQESNKILIMLRDYQNKSR